MFFQTLKVLTSAKTQ